jgi:hypothetical protein
MSRSLRRAVAGVVVSATPYAAVSDYLLTARPPAPGTVCRPDPPFPSSPARTVTR